MFTVTTLSTSVYCSQIQCALFQLSKICRNGSITALVVCGQTGSFPGSAAVKTRSAKNSFLLRPPERKGYTAPSGALRALRSQQPQSALRPLGYDVQPGRVSEKILNAL